MSAGQEDNGHALPGRYVMQEGSPEDTRALHTQTLLVQAVRRCLGRRLHVRRSEVLCRTFDVQSRVCVCRQPASRTTLHGLLHAAIE